MPEEHRRREESVTVVRAEGAERKGNSEGNKDTNDNSGKKGVVAEGGAGSSQSGGTSHGGSHSERTSMHVVGPIRADSNCSIGTNAHLVGVGERMTAAGKGKETQGDSDPRVLIVGSKAGGDNSYSGEQSLNCKADSKIHKIRDKKQLDEGKLVDYTDGSAECMDWSSGKSEPGALPNNDLEEKTG